MKTTYKYWALFVLLGNFFSVAAQTDSLANYLSIAAKHNPSVLQKYSEYQVALQKIPQVGSLSDPELSLGVFLSPMELVSGKQYADIKLMQMFPWFGTLKAAKDEMSLMAKARYETLQDAKSQLFYDVERSWYNLYKIDQNIHISEKNLAILHSVEQLALERFKSPVKGTYAITAAPKTSVSSSTNEGSSGMNGMGAGSTSASSTPSASMSTMPTASGGSGLADLYRIQMEIGELENTIALLKDQKKTLTAAFNSYLNRPSETSVFIPDNLSAAPFEVPLLNDTLFSHNPMLTMLDYEKQSFEARKKMVTKMGYPMIGLGVNYSVIGKSDMSTSSMNGKDMIMPMATITLPIYRGKYKAMKSEANWMQTSNAQAHEATVNSLKTEYYQALEAFQDAKRRMQLYDNQSKLSEQTQHLLIKSFAAGSATGLNDVLTVSRQSLDYELKKSEAVADYNIAVAWLKKLLINCEN
jgi:outer membrane protein TolC